MSRKGQRIGRWTLLEQLGQGGNGSVYRANDGTSEVALKLLLNSRPKRYQRFRDEVEVLRRMATGLACYPSLMPTCRRIQRGKIQLGLHLQWPHPSSIT